MTRKKGTHDTLETQRKKLGQVAKNAVGRYLTSLPDVPIPERLNALVIAAEEARKEKEIPIPDEAKEAGLNAEGIEAKS